jgi:hypothetical protein
MRSIVCHCRLCVYLLIYISFACSCFEPRQFDIALDWKNKFIWQDVESSGPEVELLTPAEIDLVKSEGLETLTAAFEHVPNVRISDGENNARDTIEVRNLAATGTRPARWMALGETDPICLSGACPPSRINYDLHMMLAQRYAAQLKITDRREILRAIGRGIGNTAAHEFGHRHRLARMDQRSDPQAFTYSDDHPSLFYGERLHWPRDTLEDMRVKLR